MTRDQTRQDAAIAFLKTHASTGPSQVEDVIQTHGAFVFLHGDEALKIKRAVKYDYLDFSTLAARKAMLDREVTLNRDAAPGLYRDVVPLTRAADGSLALDGKGEVVEWVLRMARFPVAAELSFMADAGQIDDRLADDLGRAVAGYHRNAPVRRDDGRALIREIIAELGRVMGQMHPQLGADPVTQFLKGAQKALAQQDRLLDNRSRAGWVRRCHGDLHLRNIVMWHGVPTPFDALEFDERLGTCDVLYDLAFLLMDLAHHDLAGAANLTLNAYLFHSAGDDHYAGLAALPLFLAIRAAIRAMVGVQTAAVQDDPTGLIAEARDFMAQALSYLKPRPPRLVAIGGLSGSGKTTLSRRIAPLIGPFPGAVHLRSDLERKALFGVDPLQPLPATAYQPQISDRIYHIMRDKARLALRAGHAVVLDAVHATQEERDLAAAIADEVGCPFTGLWLDVNTAARVARVESRGKDASDADAGVARRQDDMEIGKMSWHRIDAGQSLGAMVAQIRDVLERSHPSRPEADRR